MTCPSDDRAARAFARTFAWAGGLALVAVLATPSLAAPSEEEDWSVHGQATVLDQYHPAFRAPYDGANSLRGDSAGRETFDATLYLGARLWTGAEAYADPEIDQGFGLSNTLGVAGFPSGEAYKVGRATPYFRLQRLFLRQSFDLGGDMQNIDPAANQLGGQRSADNLVITAGKISVVDIFDTNTYAHDPRADFMNWALIDGGAFDYAADAWGYSYGATAELTMDWWTLRAGAFALSRVPNTTQLDTSGAQFEMVGEGEARYDWAGRQGKIKLLGFVNRGQLGTYDDALALAARTGGVPDIAAVRRYRSKPGMVVNVEQPVSDDVGLFARASMNDGSIEADEFTEINKSLSLGAAIKGTSWSRSEDTLGVAGVIDMLSDAGQRYFAAGGMGILIGDGKLPNPGNENIAETYYTLALLPGLAATLDYQLIVNPAYNRDRGPVSVLGFRLHGQF